MAPHLLYTLFFFFPSTLSNQITAETQKLQFTILQNDKEIGEVVASKTTIGDRITYTSYSESTTHLVIKITIVAENELNLENGHVMSAEANVTVRRRPYAHSYTQYCSGQCEMVKDGHEVIYIDETIHYASTMLLFEEPIDVSYSYSELDGSFHPIKKVGAHTYEKKDVKGKINRYFYEDGVLNRAEIDAGLISFEMERR